MVARSVRWRSGPVRRPPVSRLRRWPSRSRRSAGVSVLARAAASSMASGMPSRRRQISSTVSLEAAASKVQLSVLPSDELNRLKGLVERKK